MWIAFASLVGCARGSSQPTTGSDPLDGWVTPSEEAGDEQAVLTEQDTQGVQPGGGTVTPNDAATGTGPDTGMPVDNRPDTGSPQDEAPECLAGTYVGTFSGNITALFFLNLPISGQLELDVTNAEGDDVLIIENGRIDGNDQDGNPVEAQINGQLDCTTRTLTGTLDNGVYRRLSINQTVNFSGTTNGTYVPGDPPVAMGTWRTSGGIEMGEGTFSGVRVE